MDDKSSRLRRGVLWLTPDVVTARKSSIIPKCKRAMLIIQPEYVFSRFLQYDTKNKFNWAC